MNRVIKGTASAAIVACAAVVASGCSAFEIHGTVTSKQYIPGYTSYYNQAVYTQTCTTEEEEETEEEPNGKGIEEEEEPEQVCTNHLAGYRSVPLYHSECWQLSVAGKQGGDECVSESQYDNTVLGSTV
jgi:hypothetical protein